MYYICENPDLQCRSNNNSPDEVRVRDNSRADLREVEFNEIFNGLFSKTKIHVALFGPCRAVDFIAFFIRLAPDAIIIRLPPEVRVVYKIRCEILLKH